MAGRGHEQPDFDNAGEDTLFSTAPIPEVEKSDEEPRVPVRFKHPTLGRPKPDPQVIIDEADRELERIDSQSRTTDEYTRRAAGEDAMTPQDTDKIIAEKARKILAQSPPKPRPKPRRSGFGHKADAGNADKTVETLYGKPGEIL